MLYLAMQYMLFSWNMAVWEVQRFRQTSVICESNLKSFTIVVIITQKRPVFEHIKLQTSRARSFHLVGVFFLGFFKLLCIVARIWLASFIYATTAESWGGLLHTHWCIFTNRAKLNTYKMKRLKISIVQVLTGLEKSTTMINSIS